MRVSIISSIKLKNNHKNKNNLLYIKNNFNNNSFNNNLSHQINNIKYVLLKGIKRKKENTNKIIFSTHYIGNIDNENFGMTSHSSIYNNFNCKEKLNFTDNKNVLKKNLSSINLSNFYLNKLNKNKNQSKNKNEITEYKNNKNYVFKKIDIPLNKKKIFFEFFDFQRQTKHETIFLKNLSNYLNKKIFFKKNLENKRFIDKNYQEFINEKKIEKNLKNNYNSVYKNILTKKNLCNNNENKLEENTIKNIKPNTEFIIRSKSFKKYYISKIQQINETNNYKLNMKSLTSRK